MTQNCKDGVCETTQPVEETEQLSTVCEQGMFGDLGIADNTAAPVTEK